VKVVLLCGGDSLRFKNQLIPSSKVMAPIGGKPIVEHIMQHYSSYGFNEFILCVKDSDQEIDAYFKHQSNFNDVQVVKTGDHTPTGGRLKRVEKFLNDETFMLSYGDGLSDVNLAELFAFHNTHGGLASLTAVQPFHQFGILKLNDNQSVIDFIEKPQMTEWINGGFFVFNRKVFVQLKDEDILEANLLHHLAQTGELHAYYHKGFWKSMDTYKDYEDLNEKFDKQ
jgi:glucose-1-phosphate cytidylyltransferase